MIGGKELNGKRVQLRVAAKRQDGVEFRVGDTGTFLKRGVVRCVFKRDDGEQLLVSHWSRLDFTVLS